MADSHEERVRKRAHEIWEREGRPHGRADDHWALAREEVAIEENYRDTLKPGPIHGPDDTAARTEPVEPALAMANQGEMPGVADQGEEFRIPGTGDRDPVPEPAADASAPQGVPEKTAAPARPSRRGRRDRAGSSV